MKWLASLVKWLLIIIAAAIAFYCVYPKYYFDVGGCVRCNKITGKVEMCWGRNGKWTTRGDVIRLDQVQNRWQGVPIVQQGR